MIGPVVIVLLVVVATPLSFMVGGAVIAAVIGALLDQPLVPST